jgi:hypothetical protein
MPNLVATLIFLAAPFAGVMLGALIDKLRH